MNKYQEAIMLVREMLNTAEPNVMNHLAANRKLDHELQELVERATPKKPKNWKAERRLNGAVEFNCPVCNRLYTERVNFCASCGQVIDWGTDDE